MVANVWSRSQASSAFKWALKIASSFACKPVADMPPPFLPDLSSVVKGLAEPRGSDQKMSNPGAWCLNNNALATPQPRWRQDGQEIFYPAPYGFLMSSVHVSGSAIEVGAVRPLFW